MRRATAVRAQTLIEEWGTAKFPAPPPLKAAKIEAKETAMLVMDFTKQTCTPERRKRCADQVPKVVKFVAEARAKGALIIYSVAVPNSVPADILPALTPAAGEQVLPPLGPDKFINSDLEKTLKDKGIKTVVAMGTQAQTSVLHTGHRGAEGLQGDRAGRRHVGRRGVPRALHRLASRHRGADQPTSHADQVRDDLFLSCQASVNGGGSLI